MVTTSPLLSYVALCISGTTSVFNDKLSSSLVNSKEIVISIPNSRFKMRDTNFPLNNPHEILNKGTSWKPSQISIQLTKVLVPP